MDLGIEGRTAIVCGSSAGLGKACALALAEAGEAGRRLEQANPSRRVGRPEELEPTGAFLASRHGGYINGQSLLLDGGAYPGVL